MKTIDIIVAVRNEEASLPWFFERIDELPLPLDVKLGCIFVEDGSTDRTREMLRHQASQDPRIKYIFLAEGRGQAPAIALGIAHSRADAVIMMDVDGGHPLEVIPLMAAGFVEGAGAVQAVRRRMTKRSRYRDIGTAIFNRCYRVLTGIDTEKQNVYYRLVSRAVFQDLIKNNRWKHFLRINYRNYSEGSVRYVSFDAAERLLGQSKYDLERLLRFAIIAVLSSMSGARFVTLVGLAFAIAGLLIYSGFVFAPLAVLAIAGTISYLFIKMSCTDVLASFTIKESVI
jgi:dolichol-phosphate mannosyltransferase